jgi:16S rRNA (cytosine967-C5)-methyltransferase
VPVAQLWPETIGTDPPAQKVESPFLRLSPLRHGTDGFFAAAMVRMEKETAPESET